MELNFVELTADLVNLCILLPEDKRLKSLNMIAKLLSAYKKHTFVSIKDFEKCTGMLNYACQAIPIGHPCLQSAYALQWVRGDHTMDHTVSDLVMKDLMMFKSFLSHDDYFVKSVPFLDRLGKLHGALEIKADAAGNPNLGSGCFLLHTSQWFGQMWTDTDWFTNNIEANRVIYQLELFAITLAFKVFGPSLTGRVVILRSDNNVVVSSINKMSSFLESTMGLLHDLTLTCMSLQILVKTIHIRGNLNMESDLISWAGLMTFWWQSQNPEIRGLTFLQSCGPHLGDPQCNNGLWDKQSFAKPEGCTPIIPRDM